MPKKATPPAPAPAPARSRFALRRDQLRGGPPRPIQPHGTVAAARRHQKAREAMCAPCAAAWAEHQHEMYLRRRQRAATPATPAPATTSAKRRARATPAATGPDPALVAPAAPRRRSTR